MTQNIDRQFEQLRNRAQDRRKHNDKTTLPPNLSIDPKDLNLDDAQRLIEELHIYHTELEIQNEELRASQIAVEHARDSYSVLYHNSPVGYVTMNRDSMISQTNRTFGSIINVRLARIIARPFSFFVYTHDIAEFSKFMQDLFDLQKAERCELRLVTSDDKLKYVELTGSILKNENGVAQCQVVIQDIGERKEMQHEQALLTKALEAGTEGIVICNMQSSERLIVYANSAIGRMLGQPIDKLIGTPWQTLYESAAEIPSQLIEAVEQEAATDFSLQSPSHSDGNKQWYDISAYPIHDFHNQIVNFVHIWRNVTKRIQTEEIVRRTQHLESVGALSDNIAKQYGTLISNVISQLSLLQLSESRNALDDKALNEALESAQQARALSRQMLVYAGRSGGEQTKLDINAVVRETVAILEATRDSNCTISLKLDKNPLIVNAKRGEIQQVILNLLLNALEASPENSQVIITTNKIEDVAELDTVAAHWQLADQPLSDVAQIIVKDKGDGIDASELDLIFDPFYSTKETGRGLGLAATLSSIRSASGHLGISTSNSGTSIVVLLPLR